MIITGMGIIYPLGNTRQDFSTISALENRVFNNCLLMLPEAFQ